MGGSSYQSPWWSNVTTDTVYFGLQVQGTSAAVPVPIVYGHNIVAPNVIWYANFQAHVESGGKGGGKGGGGKTGKTGSSPNYVYTADIIMGICEGPIAGVGKVWQTSPVAFNLEMLGLSLFDGTTPQAVWSYLAAKYPTEALTYPGTAYVCAPSWYLGPTAGINTSNFEVYGVLAGSGFMELTPTWRT